VLAPWLKTAEGNRMKKINPFLWFDSEAEQGAQFYVGIFKNSKIGKIARYGEEAAQKTGRPPGSVMTLEFTLDRVEFVALNGGPQFKFTEAISFAVNCETQDEIDYFWEKLSADGGSTGPCGWLKDKFVFRGRSARSFSAICWPIPIKRNQRAS
jgi:predicted 3-demethylubiquinone-9 3-methyltransferase (glyoxalase superfamily)